MCPVPGEAELLGWRSRGRRIQFVKAAVVGILETAGEDTAGDGVLFGYVLVDLHDQPVLIDLRALLPQEVVLQIVIACLGEALGNRFRYAAQTPEAAGNDVAREGIADLVALAIRTGDGMCR